MEIYDDLQFDRNETMNGPSHIPNSVIFAWADREGWSRERTAFFHRVIRLMDNIELNIANRANAEKG